MDVNASEFVPTSQQSKATSTVNKSPSHDPMFLGNRRGDPYPDLPATFNDFKMSISVIKELIALAEVESWSTIPDPKFLKPNILNNLLRVQYHFLRYQKGGILRDRKGVMYMNTSLLVRDKWPPQQIYMIIQKKIVNNVETYDAQFYPESDQRIAIGEKPPLANWYPKNMSHLVWDRRAGVTANLSHILEEREDRALMAVENLRYLKSISPVALEGAIQLAIESSIQTCLRQQYIAIPYLYIAKKSNDKSMGHIQFLLPLYFGDGEPIKLAMAVEKYETNYRAATIIPVDWAYQNARALSSLKDTWLEKAFHQYISKKDDSGSD